MISFAIVVAAGAVAGWAQGGRLKNVSGSALALLPVIWLALALQLGAQFIPAERSMIAYGLVIASYAAVFAFAGANWRVAGMPLIALGGAMNYLVILLNQGMPVSPEMIARVGVDVENARAVIRGKHVLATDGTHLPVLGDRIPLFGEIVSVGDLVILAGILLVVQGLMKRRGRGGNARQVIDLRDEIVAPKR